MRDDLDISGALSDLAEDWAPSPGLRGRTVRRLAVRRARRRGALTLGVVAAVIAVAAAVPTLVDRAPEPDRSVIAGEGDEPSTDGDWTELPAAPIKVREFPATVWTGTEVLVWGGYPGRADGAAWNPATGQWRTLAVAPTPGGRYTVAAWSGTEMLLWGHVNDSIQPSTAGGLAYDPATDSWRALPDGPVPSRPYAAGVWTGTELVVWGGYDIDPAGYVSGASDGAAYNPASNSWRQLATSPLAGRFYQATVWTGDRMLVWGGVVGDGGESTQFADGASYDPITDTWETLPPAPLAGRFDAIAAWTGEALVVWGGSGEGGQPLFDGGSYDPEARAWAAIPNAPVDVYNTPGLAGAWAGTELIAWGDRTGSRAAWAFRSTDRTWRQLPDTPIDGGVSYGAAWTGTQLVLWGGSAGGDGGVVWTPHRVPPAPDAPSAG